MAGGLQLLCLSTSSGVPLYCRSKGESRQLSFSVIGSLNGVHMFGSNQDVLLTSTSTDNCRVCWRVFHDSITLIVMSSEEDASDLYFGRLLENVFNAMVLVIGLDDLVNLKNVERLKRELRACYKLIDSLLAASDWIGDLTMCVDCVASPDAAVLQEALDVFVAAAESNFGCLMVMGKTVVATEKWWRLTTQELVLLALLVGSLAPNSSRDYPIYLPHGSPTVPHRLLTFQLVPGVDVCLLCGPTPSLQQVQTELVERFWSPVLECLKTCLRVHQRSFLASINLHHSIVGLLLINREQNKNIFTLQPHADESSQQQGAVLLPERRRSVLRQFYTLAVSAYFPADTSEDQPALHEEFHTGFTHQPKECYITAADHKCYGLQTQQHQLFLTFTADTPTFALRSIATNTLGLLTKELPF
ncbi:protein fuzzy homolog isoform X2 [Narcine bancroftii]|uniref:protein fuzzy homolog isoform X2 n=1 Tax=Narcine bancroftii TaxID=1343680 RepID=UPI003831554D